MGWGGGVACVRETFQTIPFSNKTIKVTHIKGCFTFVHMVVIYKYYKFNRSWVMYSKSKDQFTLI